MTGKTTLINQLMMHILTSPPVTLVPIIIRVQQLQKRLREAADAFAGAWNWVDAYLSLEYGEKTDAYHMLRMSLLCRNAIILIDGINEATSEGGIRESIERHITEVLAPQGHVLVVTSRPIGLTDARFASFHQMSLAPLSQAQQSWAIEQSIGTERAAGLRPYLQDRCPSDIETGERISTNRAQQLPPSLTLYPPCTHPVPTLYPPCSPCTLYPPCTLSHPVPSLTLHPPCSPEPCSL